MKRIVLRRARCAPCDALDHVGTYGVRGLRAPERVDRQTRFLVGSVTKPMTTTLAATLVSEGRLGWDDPVVDHLPSFALSQPEWSALVRLRDAFGHTSGVPRSDGALAGLAAQFTTDERGRATLSIGLADFEAGVLAHPVVVTQQLGEAHAPRARRQPAADLRMLPSLPHLRRPPERAWGPF